MDSSKIKIYVVCHKPSFVPEHPYLYPIQAGAALAEQPFSGMLQDDTGDNISEKNRQYCELTPQYWAWKNEDADFYGFFHYRRYLSFREIFPVSADGRKPGSPYMCPFLELDHNHINLNRYGFDPGYMRRVISQYDILTVLRERINTSVYRQFAQFHDRKKLDAVLKILLEQHPEYRKAAREYLMSHDIYYMNMYIMRRSMFFEYMNWLFGILNTYEAQTEERPENAEPRITGFLAERLFGIFYTYQRENGAKCAEARYLRFYNTSPELSDHAESSVREFRLSPLPLKIRLNMRKLNRLCPAGSRRRLLLRSLIYR